MQWKANVSVFKLQRATIQRAAAVWQSSVLAKAFRSWAAQAQDRRRLKEVARSAAHVHLPT